MHGTAARKTKPHAILPLESAQIALNQARCQIQNGGQYRTYYGGAQRKPIDRAGDQTILTHVCENIPVLTLVAK